MLATLHWSNGGTYAAGINNSDLLLVPVAAGEKVIATYWVSGFGTNLLTLSETLVIVADGPGDAIFAGRALNLTGAPVLGFEDVGLDVLIGTY